MDDAIAQMVAFTDTSPERARQYLQVTDGNVNDAVTLFFENNGADLGGAPATPAAPQPSSGLTGAGNAQNPINIDDDNISDDNDPAITGYNPRHAAQAGGMEDDEAMARRLQEEMYGGAGEEQTIRAPIARQTETLVGPGSSDYYGGGSLDEAIQERMQQFTARRGAGARRAPGIFNQQPTSRIWTEGSTDRQALAEATGGASEANARANRLARLYAPNWDLMFQGSWEEARDEGKDQKKWLIVNIQNEKVFDCQVLNRDIWKNEGIIETVRENFIFLQYSKDDPRAEQYNAYYFHSAEVEDEYPHVAIVDPRTGEQVKLWSRQMPGSADFLMQLHEFLDRYSLDNKAKNPVAKRKSEAKKEKPVELLTEEEQLERALQASMAGKATDSSGSLKVPDEDPDDLTRSIGDLKQSEAGSGMADTPQNGTVTQSAWHSIPSDRRHQEPPQGPNITRVQIKHPDGRIVRRFDLSDRVQQIYEYLKAEPVAGKQGVEFELVAMGKNLIDEREKTIAEAGLKNGTIMVEFSE